MDSHRKPNNDRRPNFEDFMNNFAEMGKIHQDTTDLRKGLRGATEDLKENTFNEAGSDADNSFFLDITSNHDNANTKSYCSSADGITSLGTNHFQDDDKNVAERQELVDNARISAELATRLTSLLDRLQSLHYLIQGNALVKRGIRNDFSTGTENVFEIMNKVDIQVDELGFDLKTKLHQHSETISSWEKANQLLAEQLNNAQVVQKCLKSELAHVQQQNDGLHDAFRNYTSKVHSKMSTSGDNQPTYTELKATVGRVDVSVNVNTFAEDPDSSVGGLKSKTFSSSRLAWNPNIVDTNKFKPKDSWIEDTATKIPNGTSLKGILRQVSSSNFCNTTIGRTGSRHSMKLPLPMNTASFQKRENDFDSIMNFVKAGGSVVDSLSAQIEKYDADFQELQEEIYQVATEKLELHQAYEKLLAEHKVLLEKHKNFNSVVKLVADEKKETQESIREVFAVIEKKLKTLELEEQKYFERVAVFDSSIKLLERQNSKYSQEIKALQQCICVSNEAFEKSKQMASAQIVELSKENGDLKSKMAEQATEISNMATRLQNEQSRNHVEMQKLNEKEAELKLQLTHKEQQLQALTAQIADLDKTNKTYSEKLDESTCTNQMLMQEKTDLTKKLDHATAAIDHLKNKLKDQSARWNKRLKISAEESLLARENGKWLQSQVDHLNCQLHEAHERVKRYQDEKNASAQQVIAAEEERKLVDRKLEELKAALKGDAKLREALAERNESLQAEISRLRQAKNTSFRNAELRPKADFPQIGRDAMRSPSQHFPAFTSSALPGIADENGFSGCEKYHSISLENNNISLEESIDKYITVPATSPKKCSYSSMCHEETAAQKLRSFLTEKNSNVLLDPGRNPTSRNSQVYTFIHGDK